MARVIHFEISADDPERASSFYATVFGWQIDKWEGPQDYWLASTGERDTPGIDGAIMRAQDGTQKTINTLDVDDVDATVAKVVAAGGRVIMGRSAVPGVGYMAYVEDTEGVQMGLMQNDPSAQ